MGYRALRDRNDEIESTKNPQMLSCDTLCIIRALEDVAEELYMLRINDREK
jgi:hypothetical protein